MDLVVGEKVMCLVHFVEAPWSRYSRQEPEEDDPSTGRRLHILERRVSANHRD